MSSYFKIGVFVFEKWETSTNGQSNRISNYFKSNATYLQKVLNIHQLCFEIFLLMIRQTPENQRYYYKNEMQKGTLCPAGDR